MPTLIFCQTSFSCNYKEISVWNDATETFDVDVSAFENNSLFVLNKDRTMFTHTTETLKSTYYITEREKEDEDIYLYFVISDVGNEYLYMFDFKNREVKATGNDKDDNLYMIRYYVKAIF